MAKRSTPAARGRARTTSSSPQYVAFLRAINVGGHIVKMDALKAMFEAMRMADVATFIASGNVVFRAAGEPARIEATIAKALEKALGYPVPTFVRSIADVAQIAGHQPFPAEAGTLYVGFLPSQPTAAGTTSLARLQTPNDRLHFHNREIYWLCGSSLMDSTVTYARVEKALGLPATFRNISTVRRLAAKYVNPQ